MVSISSFITLNLPSVPILTWYGGKILVLNLTFCNIISIFIEMINGEIVLDELLKILKALADKNRLRIIKMLQQRTLCVCEITSVLSLATSTVSNHLSILKECDMIRDRKDGKWVDYYLNLKSKKLFVSGLLPLISFWLNDDNQVKMDLEKLRETHREDLCKT